MKFQLSYFFLAHYPWQHSLASFLSVSLPTVTDPVLDRDTGIFSSSWGPSGKVYGPCGNHWNRDGNWSEKDVPLWSSSICLDPGSIICFVSPSLTFLCPLSLEDPTTSIVFLKLCNLFCFWPSSSFLASLSLSPLCLVKWLERDQHGGNESGHDERLRDMLKHYIGSPCVFFLPLFPLRLPVSLHTATIILLFPSHLRNSRWCNPSLWSCPDQDTLFSTTIAHSYCSPNLYQISLSLEPYCIRPKFPLHQFKMKARLFCFELVCLTWASDRTSAHRMSTGSY